MPMEPTDYNINLDIRYGYKTLVDIPALVESCTEKWFNQSLTEVNDSVVRIGVLEGEFHFHKHDEEDEFFLVLEGRMLLDVEDETIELQPHQGYTVPKGVMHRPRCPERVVVLMVEKSSVTPTGD